MRAKVVAYWTCSHCYRKRAIATAKGAKRRKCPFCGKTSGGLHVVHLPPP